MHIALYLPIWPPSGSANGIVCYVSTMRDHLMGIGHQVSVLSAGSICMTDGRRVVLVPPTKEQTALLRVAHRITVTERSEATVQSPAA